MDLEIKKNNNTSFYSDICLKRLPVIERDAVFVTT